MRALVCVIIAWRPKTAAGSNSNERAHSHVRFCELRLPQEAADSGLRPSKSATDAACAWAALSEQAGGAAELQPRAARSCGQWRRS